MTGSRTESNTDAKSIYNPQIQTEFSRLFLHVLLQNSNQTGLSLVYLALVFW